MIYILLECDAFQVRLSQNKALSSKSIFIYIQIIDPAMQISSLI